MDFESVYISRMALGLRERTGSVFCLFSRQTPSYKACSVVASLWLNWYRVRVCVCVCGGAIGYLMRKTNQCVEDQTVTKLTSYTRVRISLLHSLRDNWAAFEMRAEGRLPSGDTPAPGCRATRAQPCHTDVNTHKQQFSQHKESLWLWQPLKMQMFSFCCDGLIVCLGTLGHRTHSDGLL